MCVSHSHATNNTIFNFLITSVLTQNIHRNNNNYCIVIITVKLATFLVYFWQRIYTILHFNSNISHFHQPNIFWFCHCRHFYRFLLFLDDTIYYNFTIELNENLSLSNFFLLFIVNSVNNALVSVISCIILSQ